MFQFKSDQMAFFKKYEGLSYIWTLLLIISYAHMYHFFREMQNE